MIFATAVSSQTIYNIGATAFVVIGSLTFLLTYLRSAVNKSNHDIDQNTINSLKENNEAVTNDRDGWKERAVAAEAKNLVLQNTVTAAPEIAKLALVTAKQHNESMTLQKTIIKELKGFIEAVGKQK